MLLPIKKTGVSLVIFYFEMFELVASLGVEYQRLELLDLTGVDFVQVIYFAARSLAK